MQVSFNSHFNNNVYNLKHNNTFKNIPNNTQYIPVEFETEASTGKKWGVGIASFIMPGLGQCVNKQWGKAAGMFLGELALEIILLRSKFQPLRLACLAMQSFSAYDAVKNAKTKVTQFMSLDQINNQTKL